MEEEILPGYTRVTEPLQGFSKYDLIDPATLANAQERGIRAHKYCEMYSKGIFFVEEDDCKNYVEQFKKWFDEYVGTVLSTEHRLYDDKLKLTGQIDMLAIMKNNEELAIIDIKTTSSISQSWSLQTAAYLYLSHTSALISISKPVKRIALHLTKTGKKAKIIEYTDYQNDLRMYLNCLELYRYLNPPKKEKKEKELDLF